MYVFTNRRNRSHFCPDLFLLLALKSPHQYLNLGRTLKNNQQVIDDVKAVHTGIHVYCMYIPEFM